MAASALCTTISRKVTGAGLNLIGVAALPHGARRSQLGLIPEDCATFDETAGLRPGGFLTQGEDRPGAPGGATPRISRA